jgi:hypothetical protein
MFLPSAQRNGQSWCVNYQVPKPRGLASWTISFSLGILPHDGKNITFKELGDKVHTTYNFAPSFCLFVPNFAARMLERKYDTDKFDLKDLDLHSEKGIEHDASLVRTYHSRYEGRLVILIISIGRDVRYEPDQSVKHMPYIRELIESRAENPDFLFNKSHQFFASAK